MKRLYSLDVFRFFAAFSVVFFHYCFLGVVEGYYSSSVFNQVFFWGYFGVDIFFILSGFVILISTEKKKNGLSFFLSRLKRIYPILILCSLVTIITGLILGGDLKPMLPKLFNSLSFMGDFWNGELLTAVHWTLMVEMRFYVLVAIVMQTKLWKKHKYKIMLSWILLAIANKYMINSSLLDKIFELQYSFHFVAGIIIYLFFIKKEKSYEMLPIFSLSIAMIFSRMAGYLSFIKDYKYSEIVFTNFDVLFFIILILAILTYITHTDKYLISKKFTTTLGAISYPVFLLHGDLGFFIKREIFLNLSSKYAIFNCEPFIVVIELVCVILLSYFILQISEKMLSLLKKVCGGN